MHAVFAFSHAVVGLAHAFPPARCLLLLAFQRAALASVARRRPCVGRGRPCLACRWLPYSPSPASPAAARVASRWLPCPPSPASYASARVARRRPRRTLVAPLPAVAARSRAGFQAMDETVWIRGVNWVPDSEDKLEESGEVRFVDDSFAGDTEVPDSQTGVDIVCEEEVVVEEQDIAQTLLQLASTEVRIFDTHKSYAEAANLMLSFMLPILYGEHDDDTNAAVATLNWIGLGHGNCYGQDTSMILNKFDEDGQCN
ncbi:hypothetical protein ACP4OV_006939 [Aristida adscensionis]